VANTLNREYATCSYSMATPGYYPEGTVSTPFVVKSTLSSDKVSGRFISVSGNQFRKATSLVKSTFTIATETPSIKEYLKLVSGTYRGSYYRSSPGGGRLDFISNNMDLRSSSGATIKCLAEQIAPQSGMQNEAATKALLKLADQKVNVSENLATLRSTLGLLVHPVQGLAFGLREAWERRQLRKLLSRDPMFWIKEDYKNLRRIHKGTPRSVADLYLSYVYGWKPLVEDIYTLVEDAKRQSLNPLLINGRGSSTREYYVRPQSFNDSSGSHLTRVTDGTDLQTTRCSVWGQILPSHAGLRSLNQLGLVNPFSLAWEVTGWSFVLDWVLPIGSVFQALTAPAGLQFIDGSVSTRQRVRARYEQESTVGGTKVTNNVPATGRLIKDSYTRTTLSGWPAPGFWYDPDPFRGDRPFKALALMLSNLRGLRNL
jgi:hypothetical protein